CDCLEVEVRASDLGHAQAGRWEVQERDVPALLPAQLNASQLRDVRLNDLRRLVAGRPDLVNRAQRPPELAVLHERLWEIHDKVPLPDEPRPEREVGRILEAFAVATAGVDD